MVAFTRPGPTPYMLANTGVSSQLNSGQSKGRSGPVGPSPGVLRARSGRVDETVEHAHPELQPVHGHPLVDAVEHAREVQLRRQLQRGEAEAADAEIVEGPG